MRIGAVPAADAEEQGGERRSHWCPNDRTIMGQGRNPEKYWDDGAGTNAVATGEPMTVTVSKVGYQPVTIQNVAWRAWSPCRSR